jgi:hemerythrin-like domain-containing protein
MNPIATRLTKDHQELEVLLRCLAQDAQAPECGALQSTWARFETQLNRHMEAEEQFLLPLLDASDPVEVARIRVEHARIRDSLTELGLAVELHTVREAQIAELINLLEAHTKHENVALYRLAGEKASAAIEHGIAQLLKHGVAAMASLVPRKAPSGELRNDGRARER